MEDYLPCIKSRIIFSSTFHYDTSMTGVAERLRRSPHNYTKITYHSVDPSMKRVKRVLYPVNNPNSPERAEVDLFHPDYFRGHD
ncbi:uncharacterized protein LOC124365260 isoform X2 [Homalodisca vitripennis]|uniref:uncharacterized protein LOC124365260 isoform X2 n=1 Tax=Homalodisca vitripennis TaxID=197043 RepID=UPI001EEB74DB|nr:uncharacterized protein LOC124365260 isoform X2 [Homalodisca vitripennis]